MNDADVLPQTVERAEPARLIPVVSEGAKEQRAVSVLLATLAAVGEYGRAILRRIEAPSGKTARIRCFTEVSFKSNDNAPQLRPDGMIVVTQGGKSWTCLVEAKIGRMQLDTAQIEAYLDIARDNEFDAVITLSNQFGGGDSNLPVKISGNKTRKVTLYHLPWRSVVADATLLCENDEVADTERAFLLREMIRYFTHENSGVVDFTQMGARWKDACFAFQQNAPLGKDAPAMRESIGDWFDLSHYLEIELSLAIGRPVSLSLTREHANSHQKRFDDTLKLFVESGVLASEFAIPDAASRLLLIADMNRRSLSAAMTLKAPSDKARAPATITWILRQLEKCDDPEITVRAKWPGRRPDTFATLGVLRANKAAILDQDADSIPVAFEIAKTVDLGAKFKSAKNFVDCAKDITERYYRSVGQHLRAWVPAPPKVPSLTPEAPVSKTPEPGPQPETPDLVAPVSSPLVDRHTAEASGVATDAGTGNDATSDRTSTASD